MNRKRKILYTVTAMLVAIGAISFFWRSSDEAVQVTFVGPSTNRPSMLSFAVVNTKTSRLAGDVGLRVVTNGVWRYEDGVADGFQRSIGPTNRSLFDTGIISTNRWRVVIRYTDPGAYTALDRARSNAGTYALQHGWSRIGRWIFPLNKVKRAFGPEMLGNKPARAEP